MTGDVEWGEAFLALVAYRSSEHAESVHENSNGPMAHTFRPRYRMVAWCHGEVSGQKTHGRACGSNIDSLWHVLESIDNGVGVVAVRQVVWQLPATQGMDNKSTVAYAL